MPEQGQAPVRGGLSRQVVAAVARRGDEVLLVRQQGPDDVEPNWSLPGGVVEPGELLDQALARELREETGLVATGIRRLLLVTQSVVEHPVWAGLWTAYTFEVEVAGEPRCEDPDGLVHEARWVPVPDAIDWLGQLKPPPMREPIVAYLRDPATTPGVWLWHAGADVPVVMPR